MGSRIRFANSAHRELALWAKEHGFSWKMAGSGHIKWLHPKLPVPIITSSTPKTGGAAHRRQHLRKALQQAGVRT